jgi:homoserine O-acetyltransferase
MASDISDNKIYHGDLPRTLGAITAGTMIMPSRTDIYFTLEDSEIETAMMPTARVRPTDSIWGHRAGNPALNPDDEAVLRQAVAELLAP